MAFRILALALLFVSANFAGGDEKPACNASTKGLFWPEAANRDSKLRQKASRCGELEVCARGQWHFHWQSLTVRLDQLRGGSQLAKPAGCEVLPEAGTADGPAAASDPRAAVQR